MTGPKEMLVILPTRSRPTKALRAYQSFNETRSEEGLSQLGFFLDLDDTKLFEYKEKLDSPGLTNSFVSIGERIRMCPSVNRAFEQNPDFDYYCFIGDDHRFKTKDWDKKAIEYIEKDALGWGVLYGDDKLQGKKLASSFIISGNLVRAIGYIAIPGLKHMYVDNQVMELGKALGSLLYRPDIVIEHLHYSMNKSKKDAQYEEVNSKEIYAHDLAIYEKWQENGKGKDLGKVFSALQKQGHAA